MKKVAFITDELFKNHNTGSMHPESAQRLSSIELALQPLHSSLLLKSPIKASSKIIQLVHPLEHIETIKQASQNESAIDADTICGIDSYDAALMAVGAGVVAIDGIKFGEFERAFCAVRPPGHHAKPTQAMGFCLFNNIAITAKYAQSQGYQKVLIIDFDVHHGNGTQDTFWRDESVYYFSSHQAFAYPGTGSENEIGEGKGRGYTSNHLLMPESGDQEILEIYECELPKVAQIFQPDIVLVSAGYDLHESDPLVSLNVTTQGIREIVKLILSNFHTPFVFMLEGGYNIEYLGTNVKATIEEMLR